MQFIIFKNSGTTAKENAHRKKIKGNKIREQLIQTLKTVKLSRFWPLKGCGDFSKLVKKGKFVTKIFFQIILNEVLKICTADVKTNKMKRNRNKRSSGFVLQILIRNTPKT